MSALFLFVGVSILISCLRAPLLAGLWGILVLTPIVALPLGNVLPLGLTTYSLVLLSLVALSYWLCGTKDPRSRDWDDWAALGIFLAGFTGFYSLCMKWPDFFPMGERLRDYSLIWAVIQEPLYPREPWFNGHPLYYYTGWYRFGHFIHQILGAPVWQIYHILVSIPLALLISSTFAISRRIFSGIWLPLSTALIVGLGSNIRGVQFFLQRERGNWWDPSRVIEGAINEFPAWSFILGDAHPHFLNVGFVPLIILTLICIIRSEASRSLRTYGGFAVAFISLLWLGNSNPWEVPMWAGTLLVIVLLYVSMVFLKWTAEKRQQFLKQVATCFRFSPRVFALMVVAVWACFSLIVFREQIKAGKVPVSFVRLPINRTFVSEAFMHWGFPLSIAGIFLPLRLANIPQRILAYLFLAGALFYEEVFAFLLLLLYVECMFWFSTVKEDRKLEKIVAEGFGIASLGLLLLVELVFLNDPYGGKHERMNTIFKVYTYCWFFFHMWAFAVAHDAYERTLQWLKPVAGYGKFIVLGTTLVFMCGCFFWMATAKDIRISPYEARWKPEGLFKVEQTYPGARDAIVALREEPRAVVLEAQAGSYSWCAHVSTLAEKQSYLGWANHAGLLTQEHGEVGRREKVTQEVYSSASCVEARNLLVKEGITHVVVGPLEREKHKARASTFACLAKIVESGQYQIFRVR